MYVITFLTKKYARTAQMVLAARWVGHVVAGRPWLVFAGWFTFTAGASTGVVMVVIAEALLMFVAPASFRRWRDAWAFRRRWPVLWASAQKRRPDDVAVGKHGPVRPMTVCPRLPLWSGDGFYPRVTDVAALFVVKPASGQTLADVAQLGQVIAAQVSSISNVAVEFDTATQTSGRLLVTFVDVFETSEAPRWD